MFGMDKKKDKGPKPTIFEMEEALKKDPHKKQELLKNMKLRHDHVKQFMREGSKKEEFKQMVHILHGYAALMKVVERIK